MNGADTLVLVFGSAALAAAAFGFWRPKGILRLAGLGALLAIVAPFVIAYGIGPFLGSGAGLGAALILYAGAAFTLTLAVFAALGAGLRHGWNGLR
ncbi:MAG: hypothetical protein ABL871_11365 [Terricaulis sp.]